MKHKKKSHRQRQEYSEEYLQGLRDGIAKGVHQTCVITCFVLRDKWGWGHIRLQRINGQIVNAAEAVQGNYTTIRDMEKTLLKEGGIYFE